MLLGEQGFKLAVLLLKLLLHLSCKLRGKRVDSSLHGRRQQLCLLRNLGLNLGNLTCLGMERFLQRLNLTARGRDLLAKSLEPAFRLLSLSFKFLETG